MNIKSIFNRLLTSKTASEDNINAKESKRKDATYWISKIDLAKKRDEVWKAKARRYIEIYKNSALKLGDARLYRAPNRFNIVYSNTELLCATILPEIPQIVLQRRYAKQQAENPREKKFNETVTDLIERTVSYCVKGTEIQNEFEAFKRDHFLTGRGVLWVSYDAKVNELTEGIEDERILIEHVYFEDFLISAGRSWKDVWWIARKHKMNRQSLVKRFGKVGRLVPLNYSDALPYTNQDFKDADLAEVWEIWDKVSKKIYFVCPGYKDALLEEKEDVYNLSGFFPTPEPLRSIPDNSSMLPTPEIDIYQGSAEELGRVCERISDITNKIRPRAFYPARYADIVERLTKSTDNEYIAIEDSSEIMAAGGMSAMFAYDPIEQKQNVVAGLYEQKESLKQDIYETTSIAEFMRQGSPDETATATSAKNRYGSLRLRSRQSNMNNYIKAVYKISTELICELFSIDALKHTSSIELPTESQKEAYETELRIHENEYKIQQIDAAQTGQEIPTLQIDKKKQRFFDNPTWEEVKEFLERDKLCNYLVDSETDFNGWDDERTGQANAVELLNVFTDSMSKILPLMEQSPYTAEAFSGVLGCVLDKYRLPRRVRSSIDDSLSQMIEKMKQSMENPQPQKPLPEEIIAESEMIKAQADQMNATTKAKEAQIKEQAVQVQAAKVQVDAQKAAADIDIDKMQLMVEVDKTAAEEQRTLENQDVIR